jgi:site-specific recombinase XerD
MGMESLHNRAQQRRLPFLSAHNQQLVGEYLAWLRARHYAPTTVQTTIDAIKSFCVRLPLARQPCLHENLTHATADDIEVWIHAAYCRGLAPSTINTTLNVLHRFFAFLQEHGYLARQPIHWRRHHVLVPQTLPKPMTEVDLIRFFSVIDALQDRTIFLLMLRCGLRVGEVSTLTWPAIDAGASSLRINTGKGQVDRVVYYSPDVEHALRQWQHLQPREVSYLFPSPSKRGVPLSVRAVQHRMAKYLRTARIAGPYSPHSLRHTFATQLLNAGAPLEVVKELMGHRSISMTLRYTQLYEATKRQQSDQAMARIEKRHAVLDR